MNFYKKNHMFIYHIISLNVIFKIDRLETENTNPGGETTPHWSFPYRDMENTIFALYDRDPTLEQFNIQISSETKNALRILHIRL